MGRGENTVLEIESAAVRGDDLSEARSRVQKHKQLVARWQSKIDRHLRANPRETAEEIQSQKVNALKGLTHSADSQRQLILAIQDATALLKEDPDPRTAHELTRIRKAALEMIALCHTGQIENQIKSRVYQFESESPDEAARNLRQAAFIGIERACLSYDISLGTKPLTHLQNGSFSEITREAKNYRRKVRLPSNLHDFGNKVEQEIKNIENTGREASVKEIARRLEVDEEKVVRVLPFAQGHYVRLDQPMKTAEGESDTIGNVIADEGSNFTEETEEEDLNKRLRDAVSSLESPLQRRIIELDFGLAGNDPVKQNDLFDGVYRDREGNLYSAESSVLRSRKKEGVEVSHRPQSELNDLFERGEMTFEPGTPESHELARAAAGITISPNEKLKSYITCKTGVPPRSGTIQEARRQALATLANDPRLQGLGLRYKGDDEIEHSQIGRAQLQQALINLGVIKKSDLSKMKAGRAYRGKESPLFSLAKKHGLIDPETGRLNSTKITELIGVDQPDPAA